LEFTLQVFLLPLLIWIYSSCCGGGDDELQLDLTTRFRSDDELQLDLMMLAIVLEDVLVGLPSDTVNALVRRSPLAQLKENEEKRNRDGERWGRE
jgi:hypothetical protein